MGSNAIITEYRLLQALAEELKLPLLQIARQAELAGPDSLALIRQTADMSLKLVEGYLLGLSNTTQQSFSLEPVSVSAVLYDAAQALSPLADTYNCQIDLDIAGKYGPVMADRSSLETAMLLLGYSMIEGQASENGRRRLLLAVHRSKSGLVTGIFEAKQSINRDMLKRGRALVGSARQALPGAQSGTGAGLFIANTLLSAMSTPLRLAKHQKLSGLATTLVLSNQLRLV